MSVRNDYPIDIVQGNITLQERNRRPFPAIDEGFDSRAFQEYASVRPLKLGKTGSGADEGDFHSKSVKVLMQGRVSDPPDLFYPLNPAEVA
jgi:hypothetical protein